MSNRLKILIPILVGGVLILIVPPLTMRKNGNEAEQRARAITEQKTKTDNLRSAMRYLKKMTPANRRQTEGEVRVSLNTWLSNLEKKAEGFKPSLLLRGISAEMLTQVGCESPLQLKFSFPDVDYIFERRMMNSLAKWIADSPLRDNVILPILEKEKQTLTPDDGFKLEQACKLFDWTIRNVDILTENSSVEEKSKIPLPPLQEGGMGYSYLPWETLLYSKGDFVERGRVFIALANQLKIDSVWITVDDSLWAIGLLIGDQIFVFEPKIGLPVLEPDKEEFASLEEIRTNARILTRLDVPGRYDYAYNPGEIKSVGFLVDLPPTALSIRMKLLESKLLSDERMVLFHDANALEARLGKLESNASVKLAQFPAMAQIFAEAVRKKLELPTQFRSNYLRQHGLWLMNTPAAQARLKHLYGRHENTKDDQGALSLYISSREDDVSLDQLRYDPDVQKRLGVVRQSWQSPEQFEQELVAAQGIFKRVKVDASFLLGQLHFDRGNFDSSVSWLKGRVLESENPEAQVWEPIVHYGLGRAFGELGDLGAASEHLSFECPQEPGNRLRLRYLRRRLEKL